MVHVKDSRIVSVNGDYFSFDNRQTAAISDIQAVEKAKIYSPSPLYKHEIAGEDSMLQVITGDPLASYLPDPELVFVNIHPGVFPVEMRLAYRVKLYSDTPLFYDALYIDAENGNLLGRDPIILHGNVVGTAVTKYSGNRNIDTDSTAPGAYRLRETVRGNGVETYNMRKGTNYGAAVDFTDANNVWNNVNANQDEVATDAHWGAEMTFDYYKSVHFRNSYDNNNTRIRSYVHYANSYNNAFWNGSVMTYGDGNGTTFTPLTSIDVCGHEVTHAVTSSTANLIYS
jgi:Zn-dependent metalloprotease